MGYSVAEVATRAGVSQTAVRKQLQGGGLRGERVAVPGGVRETWVVDEESAQAYINTARDAAFADRYLHSPRPTAAAETVGAAVPADAVPHSAGSVKTAPAPDRDAAAVGTRSPLDDVARLRDENRRLRLVVASLAEANRSLHEALLGSVAQAS